MVQRSSPDDFPSLPIPTVDEHEHIYAEWLRTKVRIACASGYASVVIPASCAERIAGLLDYAAEREAAEGRA